MSEEALQTDRIIRAMPLALANKIAAGEVVQRPASVVKELVENAIDAGASSVTVLIKQAGRELIQVIDDGCGMSEGDAVACFDRHATSKINEIEDLESLRTLGFRGEALASIAAVAQVELKTRRHEDETGTRIAIDGGEVIAKEPCATPGGTSMAIRNLFYNVPARRSFLKTPATEFKHIVETVQFLALSHPEVAFELKHEDHDVFRLPAAQDQGGLVGLKARIRGLFGAQHADNLVQVIEDTSYLSIRGWVSRPDFHRRTRGEQFLFVNDRYVKNRYLEHAVRTAYEEMIPDGSFPFFALFLTLEPKHVDVNVHPTKAEVKFDDERGIYGFIRSVVRKALGESSLTPQMSLGQVWTEEGLETEDRSWRANLDTSAKRSDGFRPANLGGGAPAHSTELYKSEIRSGEAFLIPSDAHADEQDGDAAPGKQSEEGLLWQLHNKYILTQIRSGLMILDQNAAHERILYEKALHSLESGFGLSQQLLFPHTIDLSPADFELVQELLPDLKSLGFELDVFSGRSVVVRGVPAEIRVGDERKILEELLEQYRANYDALKIKARDNLAKSIARRGAVQSGTALDAKEMRSLIDQLFMCQTPYTCPYGRPTLVNYTIDDLDKRFGAKPKS